MPRSLNEVLQQFEAAEANLVKLEQLWAEIQSYMMSANGNWFKDEDEAEYDNRARAFRRLAAAMPKIDGHELAFEIDAYSDVFMGHMEANEIGEFEAMVSHLDHSKRQGRALDEYRFQFDAKRRELARLTVQQICDQVEPLLDRLAAKTKDLAPSDPMPPGEWDELRQAVRSIDSLLGSALKRGRRWDLLTRHLHFGLRHDFDDIVRDDWPSVREWLAAALYGPNDPLPVAVQDLAELVASKPAGTVVTQLKWDAISESEFERLLFNLISNAAGYHNPKWLTHTNAPDRGRDLSVDRTSNDSLAGPRTYRVIIACKHWQSRSVSLDEINLLKAQMALWEPPRVDVLIVTTTGRFTTDAVQWVETHNRSNQALSIELWPDSHLERLLAERPALIAEFGLR
jgi:hypothetical protein